MRIYRMTATFGKLNHETLVLEPGLNVITAPNEWGKSTWCAFLVAMLYGLDTRAKTTKYNLADKTRYAPWSGAPMAGRIDLNWNGKDITIERSSKRRVPMGEFRAYETDSGLPVSELTAANCGSVLLGVEQTVFRRAGFIRHADLPVTQDEALRRRLNALVTSGDDSGMADRLAETLKELKNRCRYNRNGLLPQAETQRDGLKNKIEELESLEAQTQKLKIQLDEVKSWLKQLYNHQQALAYAKMLEDMERVAQAKKALEQTEQELRTLEAACAKLPSREEAERMLRELRAFRDQWNALQTELQMAPTEPQEPQMPAPFTGMTPEEAHAMAFRDGKLFVEITGTRAPGVLIVMGILGMLAAAGLVYLMANVFAGIAGVAGLLAFVWGIWESISLKRKTKQLLEKYGSANHKRWGDPIGEYMRLMTAYKIDLKRYQEITKDLEERLGILQNRKYALCGEEEPGVLIDSRQDMLLQWDAYYNTRREASRAKSHYENLNAMVRPVEKPTMPDNLTHSEAETARLLSECALEQQRMQNRLGQYQGRMEVLGDKEELKRRLKAMLQRISKLENTYAALTIAQETLTAAREELQRRFAPIITKRAQKLLSHMTEGRYNRIIMDNDFALQAGTTEEETIHEALWRSDGTIDQLYLALRLAVAEELTPKAPLVLDDVLVRFDDQRMRAAVEVLKEMAKDKQIICFSCQGREGTV